MSEIQENKNQQPEEFLRISLVNQSVMPKKRRSCPLVEIDISEIDYKNLKLLKKFISERGKIISSRISNVSRKKQNAIKVSIKRARQLGLISPIGLDNNQQN
jgi:small subunit ribosomal protein S18